MRFGSRVGAALSIALVCGAGAALPSSTAALAKSPATCDPQDRPETGLQGEVSLADQATGRSQQGYTCGVRLVGQDNIGLRGNNFNLAWLGDCGYVISLASGQGPTAMEGVAG